jgi:hypothetical protein
VERRGLTSSSGPLDLLELCSLAKEASTQDRQKLGTTRRMIEIFKFISKEKTIKVIKLSKNIIDI